MIIFSSQEISKKFQNRIPCFFGNHNKNIIAWVPKYIAPHILSRFLQILYCSLLTSFLSSILLSHVLFLFFFLLFLLFDFLCLMLYTCASLSTCAKVTSPLFYVHECIVESSLNHFRFSLSIIDNPTPFLVKYRPFVALLKNIICGTH